MTATAGRTQIKPDAGRSPKRASARAKAKPGANTHDRLLAAARSEFAQYGFAGARVERILGKAKVNPRMLYHHFGGKAEIYVAVLESALAELRRAELSLDVDRAEPVAGLLQLFDFMNDHFESNPTLVRLFTNENLLRARFMRTSDRIREMSSPVLAMISRLIERGAASGRFPLALDPLRTYVLMVALCQFHLSNVHTLSFIFDQDLSAPAWRESRKRDARAMLQAYLSTAAPDEAAPAPLEGLAGAPDARPCGRSSATGRAVKRASDPPNSAIASP
jgi:AcrR family transcriptional regulator